jgi:hypothetical protein
VKVDRRSLQKNACLAKCSFAEVKYYLLLFDALDARSSISPCTLGQSNLVYPLNIALNGTKEAATADTLPNFRFYAVGSSMSTTPIFSPNSSAISPPGNPPWWNFPPNTWLKANSTYAEQFSAVCFIAAREIMKLHNTPTRPVGLIFSAVSGTMIEPWMPDSALARCGSAPKPSDPPRASYFNGMVAPFKKVSVRVSSGVIQLA